MRRTIWTAGLAATALAATALMTGGGPASVVPRADAATGLAPFQDCDDLAQWYRDAALKEVTAYGLGGGFYGGPVMAMDGGAMPVEDAGSARLGSEAVGNGSTGTNVQEAGVDEPDVAKTDGSLVYAVDGLDLVVTDVTGEQPVERGRLRLGRDLRGAELLLVGERVVLFSAAWPQEPMGRIMIDGSYPAGPAATRLTVVDVADPEAMSIVGEREVEGQPVASREHDGTVRLVVSATPQLDLVTPGPRWDLPRPERREAGRLTHAEALQRNRELIREADAQAFLPQQRVDGDASEPLLDCADVTHPREGAGLGTIAVVGFDPDEPATVQTTGVSAGGQQVYASTDRLYVATMSGGWWGWELVGRGVSSTEVHAFDVTGTGTSYVASGEVPGTAPDRWSFSEHEGRLRVATTEQRQWRDVQSTVTVLEEEGDRLVPVGSVSGLGPGEQIQSVRWFDDLAIVVTFEQIDPLYTVDLSDPADPEVLGELKIPGFSAYLHPLGGDLLLGVGQDATRTGRTTGSQASAFDLSDLSDPRRVSALGLGRDSHSPVEDDARAFTYLPELRLALVPLEDWSRRGGGTRLAAVRVAEDGTLTAAGSLEVGSSAYGLRALPLADGRVAVVVGGGVRELVDPQRLAD